MTKKYRPSPYNYCDYRCEQCPDQEGCIVYKENHQRILDHYVKGQDPNDPKVFMEDLQEIFEKTNKMLTEKAAEEGIDLKDIPDEKIPKIDPHDYIVYRLAYEYFKQSHVLIKQLQRTGIPESVEQEYGDLVWYHTLLPAKVGRLVSGFANDFLDEEMRQAEEGRTMHVIAKSINLSKKALENMLNEMPDEFQNIADLLDLLKRLETQVKADIRKKVQGKE